MPTNVPALTTDPTFKQLSLRYIDRRGDMFSNSFYIGEGVTNAQIQTLVTACSNATNALLYQVVISDAWGATPEPSLALNAVFANTDSIMGILFKDKFHPNMRERLELPAPLSALVLTNEVIDTDHALFSAIVSATLPVLNAGGLTYDPAIARFTERRNKNSGTRI